MSNSYPRDPKPRQNLLSNLPQRSHSQRRIRRVSERGDGQVVEAIARCANEEHGCAGGRTPHKVREGERVEGR
jgi:hypothetical protein